MFLEEVYQSIYDLNEKKEIILKQKIKEKTGIEIDFDIEKKRRFSRFFMEVKENKETVYFNDGSIDGLRIVTFEKTESHLDEGNNVFKINFSYY